MKSLIRLLVTIETLLAKALQTVLRLCGRLLAATAGTVASRTRPSWLSGRRRLALLAALGLAALATGLWQLRDGPINWYEAAFDKRPLLKAASWHYQLDRVDVAAMHKIPSDVVVMDFATNNGRDALPPAEVAKMKVQPDGRRRLAIAYMSIGEAEHYRYYWKRDWHDPAHAATKPAWIGRANCAWPDSNAVNFWAREWRDIIYAGPDAYIARIVAAGFDGVYLDRVDIYEQYLDKRPSAEADMIAFVTELAAAARRLKPGFLVIAQNAEDLLRHRHYRRVIDGLGKEDLLYGHDGTGTRNARKDIDWSYGLLKRLLADHKPVLAVEYLVTREAIAQAHLELTRMGLVPTTAHRNLDGSDPTMPRFEPKVAMGTPEYIKSNCTKANSW